MIFDYKTAESILSITPNDITKTLLLDIFAIRGKKGKPLLDATTKIKITKELLDKYESPLRLAPNINAIIKEGESTVGRILVYLFLINIDIDFLPTSELLSPLQRSTKITGNLLTYIDFINAPLTSKRLGTYDKTVANLFIDDKIDTEIIKTYTDRLQWLGYTSAMFTLPSLDMATINPSKEIRNFRDKKIKENQEAFDTKNLAVIGKVTDEILEFAGKDLDKTSATGKIIYDSGFNGSFNNNYKVTAIYRGIAPKSDNINDFDVVTSSLSDGVSKEDLASHADLGVSGASGRAKDTQLAGYKTKIFNAAFGSVVAGEYNSDCKAKNTLKIHLTEKNYSEYVYRYIRTTSGTLVRLDNDTKDKYIGKVINLRTPLYCNDYQICNKCFGDMIFKLKIRNVGLHISRITTKLMNLSMKAFHNQTIEPHNYDLRDYISKTK